MQAAILSKFTTLVRFQFTDFKTSFLLLLALKLLQLALLRPVRKRNQVQWILLPNQLAFLEAL